MGVGLCDALLATIQKSKPFPFPGGKGDISGLLEMNGFPDRTKLTEEKQMYSSFIRSSLFSRFGFESRLSVYTGDLMETDMYKSSIQTNVVAVSKYRSESKLNMSER